MGKPGDGGCKAGTTFVQADSTCFRDLVQRLTGPSGNQAEATVKSPAPKPAQKLHERRKCCKPKIEIENRVEPQFQSFLQPCHPASPWSVVLLMSPPPGSLQASPVSSPLPLGNSNKRASPSATKLLNPEEEEERAIKEKRFYLHPSPRSKQRLAADPELLPLFPLKFPTTATASNET